MSVDRPGTVRPGNELDLARLGAALAERGVAPPGAPLELAEFARGFSNLTYLVTAGDRSFVLRRPPPGVAIKSAHDMTREFRILSSLAPWTRLTPRPIALFEDPAVLGAPFYLMERVEGLILRERAPRDLDLSRWLRPISLAVIDALVEIHGIDVRAAGLEGLGRPEGYGERQARGWAERYQQAKTHDVPAAERVAAWLRDHLPAPSPAVLLHNDFKYDNVVLDPADPARVKAVLDWEMATVGDPIFDLGSTLGYWLEPGDPAPLLARAFVLTHVPGNLSRREVAERYLAGRGLPEVDLVFPFVFGLFKIAVIGQQLYARYARGLTKDERFAGIAEVVRGYLELAERAIERGRIDDLG